MKETNEIIITGASSHLGSVIAKAFAAERGVRIIATMRRKRIAADKFPRNVHILDACDLTSSGGCTRLAEASEALFKRQIGLVHCAGDFWHHVPFSSQGPALARSTFASHVETFYNATHALVPIMKSRGGGALVVFSCNSTLYHYPWMAAFTAAKSAIDSLVTSLANEYSGDNIRFNSLRLSSLKTPTVRKSKPHGDFASFTPPKDVVPIVRFLLSKEAYLINGNAISVFRHSDEFYRRGYFERVSR